MIVEQLGDDGWHEVSWSCLAIIYTHYSVTQPTFIRDGDYIYLKCLLEGKPEVYRQIV